MVVGALLDSAHQVSMLTGDAPLTALHVAREVRICSPDKPALLLRTDSAGGGPRWVAATGASDAMVAPFRAEEMRGLADKYELMATDGSIEEAAEQDDAPQGAAEGAADAEGRPPPHSRQCCTHFRLIAAIGRIHFSRT